MQFQPKDDSSMDHLRAGHSAREKQLQIGVSHVDRAHLNREAAKHFENAHEKAKSEGNKSTEGIAKSYAESAHKAARDSFREAAKKTSYLEKRGVDRDAKVAELKALAKEHDAKVKEAKGASSKASSDVKKWAEKKSETRSPAKNAPTLSVEAKSMSHKANESKGTDAEQAKLHEAAREAHREAAKAHGKSAMGSIHRDEAKGHDRAVGMLKAWADKTAKSEGSTSGGGGDWDEGKHPRDETGKFS